MSTPFFTVGAKYENRKGPYTVSAINNGSLYVVYWNGLTDKLKTDLQQRIVESLENETRLAAEAARRKREVEERKSEITQEFLDRLIGVEEGEGRWTVREAKDLLDTVGHPQDEMIVKTQAFAEHGAKWGRSSTAALYTYQRLNPEHYANSRDKSRRSAPAIAAYV